MRSRWLPVLLAAGAAVVLAGTTATAVDHLLRPSSGPPPQLRAAPAAVLSQMGVSLAAAEPPAYCGLVSAAAERGVAKPSAGGCPISRQAAEAVAAGRGLGTVREAVLVKATALRLPSVGSGRVVWLLVTQSRSPMLRLLPLRPCLATGCAGVPISNQLVFVDANSARLLATLPAGLPRQGIVAIQGTPVTSALPPTAALQQTRVP